KIRTIDGGKTWNVVANGKGPGYRSCVQYIPNSNAKELVAVGFKGIDYSNDSGDTWKHLSNEGFYTIRF
ncbi:MAG: oxidoreductase, partial [Winogradskyella sp.]|nr:oxidoreductase [Winogradskyella sp.]